jgi:hypothetical protein
MLIIYLIEFSSNFSHLFRFLIRPFHSLSITNTKNPDPLIPSNCIQPFPLSFSRSLSQCIRIWDDPFMGICYSMVAIFTPWMLGLTINLIQNGKRKNLELKMRHACYFVNNWVWAWTRSNIPHYIPFTLEDFF